MSALNFSASGVRWRLIRFDGESSNELPPDLKPLPGPGLLFVSSDQETRFLSVTPDALPSSAELRTKSINELAVLIRLAPNWPRI